MRKYKDTDCLHEIANSTDTAILASFSSPIKISHFPLTTRTDENK